MADDSELETFRLQWKKELSSQNSDHESTYSNTEEKYVADQTFQHPEHYQHDPVPDKVEIKHTLPLTNNISQRGTLPSDFDTYSCCVQCGKIRNKQIQNNSSDVIFSQTVSEQNISSDQVYYPFALLDKFLKDGTECHNDTSIKASTVKKRKYFETHEPLVNDTVKYSRLSQDQSTVCTCTQKNTVNKKQHLNQQMTKESYLDIFIADLDEITEIPFFDTTVPRELGIKIFRHLGMKELCRCSQVSKSWLSLSEDDLLWKKICVNLGYEKNICLETTTNWKQIVRDYVRKKKTLISNWKGRLGKITKLEHPQGGVVCSVHSCNNYIAAGYSNGQVKLWELSSGTDCTFQPSSTALAIDQTREEGTIHNYVLKVCTSHKYTAAAYKHGFVDIWDNLYGTTAIKTIQCEGNWQISGLEMMKRQPWLALSQGYYVQIHHHGNSDTREQPCFVMKHKLDLNQMVKHIKWLQSPNHQNSEQSVLAVSTGNIVNVYSPDENHCPGTELHNLYNAPISCIDLKSDPAYLAVGCGLYGGPSESFRVKVYDLNSKQLLSTLQGHTWIITCLNLADSPPYCLVTGNGDRRVRIYDLRSSEFPVNIFTGHSAKVSAVQMDEWKVVSGDEAGFVCVWDQRMSSKLWEWHNRHPVQYSCFHEGMLTVGNVPYDKFPDFDFETIPHRRLRGSVQVYDFSADVSVKGLPQICHSTYDEPEAYDFNIRLAVPYDKL